jgi:HTH-type transcriptional repressor of NAD biosynthesis genes
VSLSIIEAFGFVTGAASVWLLVKESAWNWPVGILTGVFYAVVFADARLYADAALQGVYIALGLGGLYYWLYGGTGRTPRVIARIGGHEALVLAAVLVALTAGATAYLRSVGDSAPFLDGLTTSLSLVAVYMQARKLVECWWVWIAADVVYVPLYVWKALPLTAVLYVVFMAMCVRGLVEWRRTLRGSRDERRWARGLVVGKFLPLHTGHLHLLRMAAARVDRLVVAVCEQRGDPIAGETRRRWVEETMADVDVLVFDQAASGLADDDSAGWAAAMSALLGSAPDVVFTSEDYGDLWAKALGADHVLVDRRRRTVPVSGTAIRANPMASFRFLTPGAKAHYVKRVCIWGAESTGKTTVARALATELETLWVPEYGHPYSAFRDRDSAWTTEEFVHIAQVQNWLEDVFAAQANRVLFCDTNAATTALFHEVYLGESSADVTRLADGRAYDLYLVCDVETPFRQDEWGLRLDGPHRQRMHVSYLRQAEAAGVPVVVLSGSHADRLEQARAAVSALLRGSAERGGERRAA